MKTTISASLYQESTMSTMKNLESTTLFEMFDTAVDTTMYQLPPQESAHMSSKPRQVLGESVFSRFAKSEDVLSEFPSLGLEKLEMPELSPSVGTVTPLQLHSSIVESIFSPSSLVDSTPMFDDVDLDSANWSSLFEPSEMDIPVKAEPTPLAMPSIAAPSPQPIDSSPLYEKPSGSKRSASEADLVASSSHFKDDRDQFGVIAYNKKQKVEPLTPIVIDSSDPVASKRARNTEAARRSRARKMERMCELEEKVEELATRNKDLEAEVLRLRAMLGQH